MSIISTDTINEINESFTVNLINQLFPPVNGGSSVNNFKPSSKKDGELVGSCPFHSDEHPSFSVNLNKAVFKCHSANCNESGTIIDGFMRLNCISNFRDAVTELARLTGVEVQHEGNQDDSKGFGKKSTCNTVATSKKHYPIAYCDSLEVNTLTSNFPSNHKDVNWLVQGEKSRINPSIVPETITRIIHIYSQEKKQIVVRYQWEDPTNPKGYSKTFIQREGKKTGKTSPIWPAYEIFSACQYGTGKYVIGVEGEGCVDTLRKLGICAITWQGSDWNKEAISTALYDLQQAGVAGLIYIGDNDNGGKEKAGKVKEVGQEINFNVEVINITDIWSDAPEKNDIANYIDQFKPDNKALRRVITQAVIKVNESSQAIISEPVKPAEKKVKSKLDSITEAREKIRDLYFSNDSFLDKSIRARDYGITTTELKNILKDLESEAIFNEQKEGLNNDLSSAISSRNEDLDLSRYLYGDGGDFARGLQNICKSSITPQANAFITLLAALAPLIGNKSKIIINAAGRYVQPCVFWTAIVGYSGTNKSGLPKIIFSVLQDLEEKAYKEYKPLKEEYDKAQKKGDVDVKKPVRKRYLTSDATIPTLEKILGESGGAITYYRDEMSGMIASRNRYSNGADVQAELDQWNGGAIIVDRNDRQVCIGKSAVSRTGTIQFDILKQAAGAGDFKDSDGWFARWLFSAVDPGPRYLYLFEDYGDNYDIEGAILKLVKTLEKSYLVDYPIAPKAKVIFQDWNRYLVDAGRQEICQGLKPVYPKIESYTARLALWLHCINAALAGEIPEAVISDRTMALAVELGQFFLKQAKFIHAVNSADSGLVGDALTIYDFLKTQDMGVSAVKIKQARFNRRKDLRTADIRNICESLVGSGYLKKEAISTTKVLYSVNSFGLQPVLHDVNHVKQPQDKALSGQQPEKVYNVLPEFTPCKTAETTDKPLIEHPKPEKVYNFTSPVSEDGDRSLPCKDFKGNCLRVGDRVVDTEDVMYTGEITRITEIDRTKNKYNPSVDYKLSILWDGGRSIDNYDPMFVIKESCHEQHKN